MRFRYAHAAHPDGETAVESCLAQLAAQASGDSTQRRVNLGFVYLTEGLLAQAGTILALLKTRTGVSNWVGASAPAVCATGVEYVDEPALAILLGRFEPGLIEDMAHKLDSGRLFGGLAGGREPPVTIADRLLRGGLSGVVFASDVPLLSRLSQGCHPLPGSRRRTVTGGRDNLITRLDDERAFDALLQDAGLVASVAAADSGERRRAALARLQGLGRRGLLFVGVEPGRDAASEWRGRDDYLVHPVVAIDPSRGAVAVGAPVEPGRTMRFCVRDEAAARKDLTRICAEIREHLHEQSERQRREVAPKGAIYVSCVGRGTQLFGEQGEELRIIGRQFGDLPMAGFYGGGEISGRGLYGFAGVLTVFY
ncbi:MAG: FIST C-terminal domain-containing protein [Burkholderiaceae bacterium]|nr:FIST C-terminal domain-containing protein [Burkholderiaceae bacterium]